MGGRQNDRGSVLMTVHVLTILMLGMALALLRGAATNSRSPVTGRQWDQAFHVAEAGIDYTINAMNHWKCGTLSTLSLTFAAGNAASVTVSPPFAGVAGTYALQSTGTVGRVGGARAVTHSITVVVTATTNSVWQCGLFSNQSLRLSSNLVSDSWISGAPPTGQPAYDSKGTPTVYDREAVNAHGSTCFAFAHGSVGSNGDIVFSDSNGHVFGNTTPGPGRSVTLTGADVSGSTSPAVTALQFPLIAVPSISGLAMNLILRGGESTTIVSGTYHFLSIFTLSGSALTIRGPATIVVDNLSVDSNTRLTLDTSGGPIRVYGTGPFLLSSNTPALGPTSGIPSDLQVFVTTDNYTSYSNPRLHPLGNPAVPVGFRSNGKLVGAIYSPNAVVALPDDLQLYGSCIAQELGPASHLRVHYDQQLGMAGGTLVYRSIAMYETPADR